MKRTFWLLLGLVLGYVYGKWRMLQAPIDEYHALRMDTDNLRDRYE